jgi:hypothetical protein
MCSFRVGYYLVDKLLSYHCPQIAYFRGVCRMEINWRNRSRRKEELVSTLSGLYHSMERILIIK